jgi:hypothetical protein
MTMPPCASISVFDVDIHTAPGTIQEFAAWAIVAALLSARAIFENIMVTQFK